MEHRWGIRYRANRRIGVVYKGRSVVSAARVLDLSSHGLLIELPGGAIPSNATIAVEFLELPLKPRLRAIVVHHSNDRFGLLLRHFPREIYAHLRESSDYDSLANVS